MMDRESYNFLCSCLSDGFNVLKGVNINFFPKEDKKVETIIQHWAAMMAAQGKWDQKQDSKRIAETFAYISTNIDNFPTLPQFLRLLPEREPPPYQHRLPAPPLSPEKIADNLAKIRAILKNTPPQKMNLGASRDHNTAIAKTAIEANQTKQDADYKQSQSQLLTRLSRGK